MDRRHGKRSLPPEASEEKEIQPYSFNHQEQWTQHDQDMSVMVSALSQVIGNRENNNNPTVQSADSSESSQLPSQDQGTTTSTSVLASKVYGKWPNF